jgi:hypothetical protein
MRPCSTTTPCTPAVTDWSSSTSITTDVHPFEPVPRRLDPTTTHPRPWSRDATLSPMPAEAPVTIATLFDIVPPITEPTLDELTEAETWANEVVVRSKRTGARQRKTA